jgi:hypothetical protein
MNPDGELSVTILVAAEADIGHTEPTMAADGGLLD